MSENVGFWRFIDCFATPGEPLQISCAFHAEGCPGCFLPAGSNRVCIKRIKHAYTVTVTKAMGRGTGIWGNWRFPTPCVCIYGVCNDCVPKLERKFTNLEQLQTLLCTVLCLRDLVSLTINHLFNLQYVEPFQCCSCGG